MEGKLALVVREEGMLLWAYLIKVGDGEITEEVKKMDGAVPVGALNLRVARMSPEYVEEWKEEMSECMNTLVRQIYGVDSVAIPEGTFSVPLQEGFEEMHAEGLKEEEKASPAEHEIYQQLHSVMMEARRHYILITSPSDDGKQMGHTVSSLRSERAILTVLRGRVAESEERLRKN